MKAIETRTIESLTPYYTEEDAAAIIGKKQLFRARTELVHAIPLYIPYWFVTVGIELKDPAHRETRMKWAEMVVNGFTNRGLLVDGRLKLMKGACKGIFLDSTLKEDEIKEAAVSELMNRTRRILNPPPSVVREIRPIYYPMALVRLRRGNTEETQTFDYYRGGIDRIMIRYLHLRDRIFETDDVAV